MTNREIFNGICPYTDKPCEEWNCIKCEVEKAERDYLENKDKAIGENVMNIEVNFDNLTKEEQEQFNALVEKANKPKCKVWKPEIREKYYTVGIGDSYILWQGDVIDELNYAIGNCFITRKEAEFALERLKVIAEMKRYIAEHDDVEIDWSNRNQKKWYIFYHHDIGCIDTDYYIHPQIIDSSLYASSAETLKDMVKEIGEDRIKKYYFGVE